MIRPSICVHLLLLAAIAGVHRCSAQRYNALFNFGDSFADTGNIMVSSLPYGMTYFGHFTGRCSDGRVIIDFIAEGIGLPYLPANRARDKSFQQGANFAVTAATTLQFEFFHERNLSGALWVNSSIHQQIDRLEKLAPSICGTPQDCRDFFSKSLFVLGEFGGNDYSTGLFAHRSIKEVLTFVPYVVQAIIEGVERLIGLGGKDIIVPNVLPIGCFPLYLSLYGTNDPEDYGHKTGCLRMQNALAWHHNLMLRRALVKLRPKHPAISIRLADYYTQTMDIVLNPLKYGFTAGALRTCCGAAGGRGDYNFNIGKRCAMNGSTVCDDIRSHVSWDGIHFTEAANWHVAQGWLHGPYVDPPILAPTSTQA